MTFDSDTHWQKNPSLAWREIDGETVVISPDESVMHELNETGSFIWRQVDGRRSVAEIAALLAAEYEVAPDVALADTDTLLAELAERRLLTQTGETGSQAATGA